jgi:hypothetical protein
VKPADVLRRKSSSTKGTYVAQKMIETLLAEYVPTRDRVWRIAASHIAFHTDITGRRFAEYQHDGKTMERLP